MTMRCSMWLASLCLATLAVAAEPIHVSITLPASDLTVGQHHDIVIEYALASGYANENIAPILQIDVPDCAMLDGEVLTEPRALAGNEFLQAPFEQLLTAPRTSIGWTLTSAPTGMFHLNVLAFVKGPDGSRFVRQRFALAVKAGATAAAVAPTPSTWGRDTTLQLGDKAPPVSVTTARGVEVNLGTWLGKRPVIVSTYRAFW